MLVEGHGADIPQYYHAVNGSRRQNRSIRYVYQLTFPFLKEVMQQTAIPVACAHITTAPLIIKYCARF